MNPPFLAKRVYPTTLRVPSPLTTTDAGSINPVILARKSERAEKPKVPAIPRRHKGTPCPEEDLALSILSLFPQNVTGLQITSPNLTFQQPHNADCLLRAQTEAATNEGPRGLDPTAPSSCRSGTSRGSFVVSRECGSVGEFTKTYVVVTRSPCEEETTLARAVTWCPPPTTYAMKRHAL